MNDEHDREPVPEPRKKVDFRALIDATASMRSGAIVYRRPTKDHKLWTRTKEEYMPYSVLQQTDIRTGLVEVHFAHIDGTKEIIDSMFEKFEPTVSIWKFGACDADFSRIVTQAKSKEELNWDAARMMLTPRYHLTSLHKSNLEFLKSAMTARESLPESTMQMIVIATDGLDNVNNGNTKLIEECKDLIDRFEKMDNVKLTFIAAGKNDVLGMAVHQLGINPDAVLQVNSQDTQAITNAYRAVSNQLTQDTPVKYTQLERSVSSGAYGGLSGGQTNHFGMFGGYTQVNTAPPQPPPLQRAETVPGRGVSAPSFGGGD